MGFEPTIKTSLQPSALTNQPQILGTPSETRTRKTGLEVPYAFQLHQRGKLVGGSGFEPPQHDGGGFTDRSGSPTPAPTQIKFGLDQHNKYSFANPVAQIQPPIRRSPKTCKSG